MKKAIIFGVTGQDGSHLADLLLEKEYEVIGFNRRGSTDNTGRISHILDHERFSLVSGDITFGMKSAWWCRHNALRSLGCLTQTSNIAQVFLDPRLSTHHAILTWGY